MDGYSLLAFLIIGILAGWIAGLITKGSGFGILLDMVIGIVGAFIGNYLLSHFSVVPSSFLSLLVSAILGAVTLILVVSVIRKIVK